MSIFYHVTCRTISAKEFEDKSLALRSVFFFFFTSTMSYPTWRPATGFISLFIWFSKDNDGLNSVSALSSKSKFGDNWRQVKGPHAGFAYVVICVGLHALLSIAELQTCIKFLSRIKFLSLIQAGYNNGGACGSAAGWVGRSRVRFPMVSLEFFIDTILPTELWPWGWLSL
jgi:hypothetical protein